MHFYTKNVFPILKIHVIILDTPGRLKSSPADLASMAEGPRQSSSDQNLSSDQGFKRIQEWVITRF